MAVSLQAGLGRDGVGNISLQEIQAIVIGLYLSI